MSERFSSGGEHRPPITAHRLSAAAARESVVRRFTSHSDLFTVTVASAWVLLFPHTAIAATDFCELSNGGCYLAPPSEHPLALSVNGMYRPSSLSGDAAGIVASLVALRAVRGENARVHYLLLLEFAREHAERAAIGSAFLHYAQPPPDGDSGTYPALGV